ncbi:MAG: hypothetical protein RL684_863 [Pseudomonadota bacterium]|jgi:hypothetical protein
MRTISLIVLAALFGALNGCAATPRLPNPDAIAADDVAFASAEAASYVASELPPASSTVWIAAPPPSKDAMPSPFTAATVAALRDRGFAVAEDPAPATGAHVVRAGAAALDGGVLLLVDIDGKAASRWYERNASGALQAAGAFAVRMPR